MDINSPGRPMTMHINFSAEMENFIRAKVASGLYGNATEVIRDAIRRMQAEDSRLEAWRAAVAAGERDLAEGAVTPYGADTLRSIAAAALEDGGTAKNLEPDVLP